MRTRRKTDHCLNCGFEFKNEENYCPQCGQENNDKTVSVRVLASELAEEALNLDSRVFRSLIPFFFKPGYLAIQFNAGRRVNYVAPLRIYLLSSFIYFFIASLGEGDFFNGIKDGMDSPPKRGKAMSDSTRAKRMKKALTSERHRAVGAAHKALDSLHRSEEGSVLDNIEDSISKSYHKKIPNIADSIRKNNQGVVVSFGSIGKIPLSGLRDGISPDQLLDSLKVEKTFINRLAAQKAVMLSKKDGIKHYLETARDNLSVAMFLLIPAMAWLLKLLYFRRRILYVQHFVFVMYTQGFVFMMLAILTLGNEYLPEWSITDLLTTLMLLSIPLYIILGMKRMYAQSWRKTIFKMGLFSFSFFILLVLFLIGDLLISFFLI